jgi:hypothetical protein
MSNDVPEIVIESPATTDKLAFKESRFATEGNDGFTTMFQNVCAGSESQYEHPLDDNICMRKMPD